METKPYSIQSPEQIAKDYGGNKQKIAMAMQMGIVDPTAGTLAGMFIDRMRSAQMQEQAPQQTVAQQVFAPPAPPAPTGGPQMPPQGAPAPMGPSAGLGATPEAAMMQAPMPEMPPQEPPMGMAEGGLATLSVPDDMFDEPDDGGYAGGGIVAFDNGGSIDPARLRAALRAQESSGDYGVMNAEGSGAMGAYQFMPNTARALAERLGMDYRPDLMSGAGGRSKEGRAYQERLMDAQMKDILNFAGDDVGRAGAYHFAGPNEKGYGPKTRQYESDILRRYSGSKDTGEIPERDIDTAEGRAISLEDSVGLAKRYMEPSEEELGAEGKVRARLTELGSDEYYEKQRKDSMWETLATIGFNMASSKAPSVLQAIGEAASAALPGAIVDKKERKALKDRALNGLMELGAKNRQRANEAFKVGTDIYKSGVEVEQAEKLMSFRERELASNIEQRNLDRLSTQMIASLKPSNPSDLEIMMQIMQKGTPEQQEALKKVMTMKNPGMTGAPGMGGLAGVDLSQWGQPTVVPQ